MPVETFWYIEGRVIYQHFSGTVTVEDVAEVSRAMMEFVQHGQPPIHTLADMRAMERFPTSLSQINKSLTASDPADLGWTVIIGLNPAVQFILTVLSRVARFRYRAFPTLEAGLRFLEEQDSTLELPADPPVASSG